MIWAGLHKGEEAVRIDRFTRNGREYWVMQLADDTLIEVEQAMVSSASAGVRRELGT